MIEHKITFVVFTYNEESRIKQVIENLKKYGEILINDANSSDKTVAIAQANGCKVINRVNSNKYSYVENYEVYQQIRDNVDTEWIYWAYADEFIPFSVLDEVLKIIKENRYDVIKIIRKNYFYGKSLHDAFASYQLRFFKKDAIDFRDNKIHSFGKLNVPISKVYELPSIHYIHHFDNATYSSLCSKGDKYSNDDYIDDNYGFVMKVILWGIARPLKMIILNYFIKGAWKAGFPGLFYCMVATQYPIMRLIKDYEKKHYLNKINIEMKYNEIRTELLKE